jgi:hypothetical protein
MKVTPPTGSSLAKKFRGQYITWAIYTNLLPKIYGTKQQMHGKTSMIR